MGLERVAGEMEGRPRILRARARPALRHDLRRCVDADSVGPVYVALPEQRVLPSTAVRRRALRKIGVQEEWLLRSRMLIRGRREDSLLFAAVV